MDHGRWETGIGEAEVPPAPCRQIAITPGVRAYDEAQQRAREAVRPSWLRPQPAPELPARLPMESTFKIFGMKNRPRKGEMPGNAVFRNCEWCEVRLTASEMEKHRKACEKRPRRG